MIKLENVKKGDYFFEREHGQEIGLLALEDARRHNAGTREEQNWGFACNVVADNGHRVTLYESDGAGGYGLRLFEKSMWAAKPAAPEPVQWTYLNETSPRPDVAIRVGDASAVFNNQPPFYYVGSSHGTLIVSKSGRVLEVSRERSCNCRLVCDIENVLWVDLPEYFEFFGDDSSFIDILDVNLIFDPTKVDPENVIEPFAADRRDPVEYYEDNGEWPKWGAALELPEPKRIERITETRIVYQNERGPEPTPEYQIFSDTLYSALEVAIETFALREQRKGYTVPSAMLQSLLEAKIACEPGGVGVRTKTGGKGE